MTDHHRHQTKTTSPELESCPKERHLPSQPEPVQEQDELLQELQELSLRQLM